MKIVAPYKSSLTDANANSIEYFNTIISTNAVDETVAEYNASTTYSIGDEVKIGSLERKYTSKINSNTSYPFSSANWVDMGALNSYSCFDSHLSSTTKASSDLIIELDTSRATKLALINLKHITEITLVTTDNSDGSTKTEVISLRDYGVNSLYDYAYKPLRDKTKLFHTLEWLPSSSVKMTMPAPTQIEVGMILTGVEEDTGITLMGSSVGFKDYSKINTDDWGNTTFVPRGVADIIDANIIVDTSAIDGVLNTFKNTRASLNLFIGDERDKGFESMSTVGFVQDIKIPIDVAKSQYSISIIGVI